MSFYAECANTDCDQHGIPKPSVGYPDFPPEPHDLPDVICGTCGEPCDVTESTEPLASPT